MISVVHAGPGDPIAIFHHKSVSPRKIAANLMLTMDLEEYTPEVPNSINRYDWCHAMYWGDGDFDDYNDLQEYRRLTEEDEAEESDGNESYYTYPGDEAEVYTG